MKSNPKSIGHKATACNAAKFFCDNAIHTAPVIDDAGPANWRRKPNRSSRILGLSSGPALESGKRPISMEFDLTPGYTTELPTRQYRKL